MSCVNGQQHDACQIKKKLFLLSNTFKENLCLSVYSTWSKQLYMRKIIDVRDGDITKERQNDSGMPEASMWTPLTVNTQEYRLMIMD